MIIKTDCQPTGYNLLHRGTYLVEIGKKGSCRTPFIKVSKAQFQSQNRKWPVIPFAFDEG